ncbi:hypothetical protein L484_020720 [Morus notabilis]|uniref:Uncharacterized protein n=1 Tax=Morus notabilis TaxID=981085 RepID=W9QM14_9ROSA|nr:proline-rich receptor-like protein kinase PERK2 [Morus notabilis]EXB40985.1 hypothetical protein L484_020720 [Morus notabilis]
MASSQNSDLKFPFFPLPPPTNNPPFPFPTPPHHSFNPPPRPSIPPPSPIVKPPPHPHPLPPPSPPHLSPPPTPMPPRPSIAPPHPISPPPKPPRPPIAPPQPISPPPPPHVVPPPSPTPGHYSTVIVVVFVSLGGLFFLAFLSVALCCFIKKKKRVDEKAEIINFDEHKKVQEAIVPGPNGEQVKILTIEEDVHIDEEIKKAEKVMGGSSHVKSAHHHQPQPQAQAIEVAESSGSTQSKHLI